MTTETAKTYNAALVVIGNEILSGRTQDANTPWIAEKLGPIGVRLAEVRVVPDEEDMIIEAVNALRARYDYVLTTGGIGPTHDDITTASIARAFNVPVVMNEDARAMLAAYYTPDELSGARLKMAMVPEGAALIENPVTAAPGYVMENVFVMAGVPRIMRGMMDHVMSMMEKGTPYISNTISCMLLEGQIAEDLARLQSKYPAVNMGSYPHYRSGVLGLSFVVRGVDRQMVQQATDDVVAMIRHHGDEPRAISIQSK